MVYRSHNSYIIAYSRGEKEKKKNIIYLWVKLINNEEEKESVLKLSELGLVPHQILYEPIIFNKENKEKEIKKEEKKEKKYINRK